MSEHKATIEWKRTTEAFDYRSYSRDHDWTFDAGISLRASAARAFLGSEDCVDPEEAFVASLSSCHMLSLLAIASRAGLVVDSYRDEAIGLLARDERGRLAVTKVTLRPEIAFGDGRMLTPDELRVLHDQAHHECFIANSVKTEVIVEPK